MKNAGTLEALHTHTHTHTHTQGILIEIGNIRTHETYTF